MDEQINTAEIQTPKEQRSFGPLVGILIIVILLIFGGLYFWGASLQDEVLPDPLSKSPSFEVIDTTIEEYTMTDEEFNALIGDNSTIVEEALETTFDDFGDLDSLDAELEALELEL